MFSKRASIFMSRISNMRFSALSRRVSNIDRFSSDDSAPKNLAAVRFSDQTPNGGSSISYLKEAM